MKGSSFAPSVIDERTEARQVVVNVKVGPPSKCWLLRLVRLWRRHPDDSPADQASPNSRSAQSAQNTISSPTPFE